MKILEDIYLVGSGHMGVSHRFDCNVYLVDGGDELALIDSGAGVGVRRLMSNIRKEGFAPEKIGKILLTHHHADHSGGCAPLLGFLANAKTCLHRNGVSFVEEGDEERMGLKVAKRSGVYSASYTYRPFKVSYALSDRQTMVVGRYKLKAHHVPGHSPDATCYLMKTVRGAVLFTGDVVFFGGRIGLLNRSGSNLEEYRKSFPRIAALDFKSLLPGHGVFILEGGKRHVILADKALKRLQPPANFI
jgi:glyoxylase-like metal-dependent hydrolase (beta-lactamase superfamily II)